MLCNAVGALESLSDVLSSKVKRIDIELEKGEHILITTFNGSMLALDTAPRPNLGLIRLILHKYEKQIKGKGGVGFANAP